MDVQSYEKPSEPVDQEPSHADASTEDPARFISGFVEIAEIEIADDSLSNGVPPDTLPLSDEPSVPTKSRTALKRELKFQKRLERCKQHREMEKKRRKEKFVASRQRMQAASTPENPYISRRVERRRAQEKLTKALTEGVRLCVDLSFEELMSRKEIGQLASQICYMYSSNKKVDKPFCMHLTSLRKGTTLYDEVLKRCPGFENYKVKVFEEPLENVFNKEELVYMSPDSPNVLERVDPTKVYVIGGLVDGTPKRQVSLSRSQTLGCQSVRLPIVEYMKRSSIHGNMILTLNQVYEILMRFNETGSWEQALDACVPRRKGFIVSGNADTDSLENISEKKDSSTEEANEQTEPLQE